MRAPSEEGKQDRRLHVAAIVAAGSGPCHVGYEYHDHGDQIAWTTPEYSTPRDVAERSLAIADALIALIEGE